MLTIEEQVYIRWFNVLVMAILAWWVAYYA